MAIQFLQLALPLYISSNDRERFPGTSYQSVTIKTEPITLFDRVAIGFGAAILGYCAGLVAAVPLTLDMFDYTSWDFARIAALLFYKVPILFGLFSGVAGFFFPVPWSNGLGEVWKIVINRWLG